MIRASFLSLLLFTASAFAADFAGEYRGTYTSADGTQEGKVRTIMSKGTDAGWDCKFFFTTDSDDEIEAKTISCVIDGSKVTAHYEATVGDSALKITSEATLAADNSLAGTYKTFTESGDPSGSGTWKTSPKQ